MAEEEHPERPRPKLAGKYKLVKTDNLDEFLRADGAGFMARKMISMINPDFEVKQDKDNFVFFVSSSLFKRETKFTVGEEFEEEQGKSGNVMKCIASWDGDKLVIKLTPKVEGKGKPQVHTRYLQDEEFLWEMQIGDVKAVRHFQRYPDPPSS